MEQEGYNGWRNYETWVVSLWMDNDAGSQSYWANRAQEIWEEAEPKYKWETKEQVARADLAEYLKDSFEEANPLADGASVWSDLMSAALGEVDWWEIAEASLSDVDKTEIEEEELI